MSFETLNMHVVKRGRLKLSCHSSITIYSIISHVKRASAFTSHVKQLLHHVTRQTKRPLPYTHNANNTSHAKIGSIFPDFAVGTTQPSPPTCTGLDVLLTPTALAATLLRARQSTSSYTVPLYRYTGTHITYIHWSTSGSALRSLLTFSRMPPSSRGPYLFSD